MKHQELKKHSNKLITSAGAIFPGERAIFQGKDIHKEMDVNEMGWFGQMLFGVTKKEFSKEQIKLLEAIWFMTAYPDARLWCNRVVALAGSTRSTASLALSAGNAISEATIYGRRNEAKAISFFQRTKKMLDEGKAMQECLDYQLKKNKVFPGYGRPLASGDERMKPSLELAATLGLADGIYVKLSFAIEKHLIDSGKNLKMNFGALVSAYMADFGLTATQFNTIYYSAFQNGMNPCYMEALEKSALTIFPTSCLDINYEGVAKRQWI